MRIRICVFVLIVLAACVINATFETAVHPSASTSLAVGQLEDSESAAIGMRTYDRLSNTVPQLTWAVVALSGLALFSKPFLRDFKTLFVEEENS